MKKLLNGAVLFIGLGLIACSQFNKGSQSEQVTVLPKATKGEFERWNLKPGSMVM